MEGLEGSRPGAVTLHELLGVSRLAADPIGPGLFSRRGTLRAERELDGGKEGQASTAEYVEGLEELWNTAVRCVPASESLPPAFGLLVGHPRAFEGWLEGVSVRWADTGDVLTADQVRALRLTCLFLDA